MSVGIEMNPETRTIALNQHQNHNTIDQFPNSVPRQANENGYCFFDKILSY